MNPTYLLDYDWTDKTMKAYSIFLNALWYFYYRLIHGNAHKERGFSAAKIENKSILLNKPEIIYSKYTLIFLGWLKKILVSSLFDYDRILWKWNYIVQAITLHLIERSNESIRNL